MSDKPRYVVDTNVLVDAACFKQSFGRRAFDIACSSGVLIYSSQLLLELADVLARPRLRRFIAPDEATAFLELYTAIAKLEAVTSTIDACRDPNDNMILALAVDGRSAAIITRDHDLLTLDPFRGVRIIEAQAFVESHSA
jgi:hypothetical protein